MMVIPLRDYKGEKVAVLGLGKSGESVVHAFLEGGAEVIAWDDNVAARENLIGKQGNLPNPGDLKIINPEAWQWNEIACFVPGPGVPLTHPEPHLVIKQAVDADCRVAGELELLREADPDGCIIGITGTNGKSTTTALIGHIMRGAGIGVEVGGNIGTPMLALEFRGKENGVYVLELSSYQLDLVSSAGVNIALLLNISADHIDRHGDMEGYVAAKCKIFANQGADDVAIISIDDSHCSRVYEKAKEAKARTIGISVEKEVAGGVFVRDGVLYDNMVGNADEIVDLRKAQGLRGKHNWQNAAAAYAVCRAYGMSVGEIIPHIVSFPGLRHRMQHVAVIGNVGFINDSKATNAEAASHALGAFKNIYWIAGGRPKEEGIVPLEKYFAHVRHAYLVGEAAQEFAVTLEGKVPYTHCGTLDAALKVASTQALENKGEEPCVLLAPACSSFDQWDNFEQRGDAFCEAVMQLVQDVEPLTENAIASGSNADGPY